MTQASAEHRSQTLNGSRRAAVDIFQIAAREVPAYRALLQQRQLDPATIITPDAFERLAPITDKKLVFDRDDIAQACRGGTFADAVMAYTSSGYSGVFSFGFESAAEGDRLRQRIDEMLVRYFHVDAVPTLLINALPMAVRVPATRAMVIETSTRTDAAIAAVKKLGPRFGQIIIVGEHPFLKTIVETGIETGINWPCLRVSLITGGEVMPENFRAYVGALLGHRDDGSTGAIVVSLGISEVSLSLGQETPDCQRIRRAAHANIELRKALFNETRFVPTFVQWSPHDFYIETPVIDGRPRLVVTTLDPHRRVPLIRYCTGDWAAVYLPEQVRSILRACGIEQLIPVPDAPMLAMWGRGKGVQLGDQELLPGQIKEAIYADPDLARAATGDFELRRAAHGAVSLLIQTHPGHTPSQDSRQKLATAIGLDPQFVSIQPPTLAIAPTYQRKFRYLA